MENDYFKPTHPTKVWKIPYFFFEGFPKTLFILALFQSQKYQTFYIYPVIFVMKGKYREIEDRGERKRCMAACNDQTFRVTSSSNSFPGEESYYHRKSFCIIVR